MLGMIYSKIIEEIKIVNDSWIEFRIRAKGPASIIKSFAIIVFCVDDKVVFDFIDLPGPYFFCINDNEWPDPDYTYSKGDIVSIFCPKPSSITSGKHEISVFAHGTTVKAKFKKEIAVRKDSVQFPHGNATSSDSSVQNPASEVMFDFNTTKNPTKSDSEPLFDFGVVPAKASGRKCPNCGFPIDPSTGKCTVCGTKG
jgi:hypothetical protein